MADIRGIFNMQTPRQLFNKMVHDANLVAQYPADAALCFNFFVTAEHLPDWLLPGDEDADKRKAIKADPVLRICSQIANGGKHFVTRDKTHKSIASTAYTTFVTVGATSNEPAVECSEFLINLNPQDEAALKTPYLTVRQLVKLVLDFWEPRVAHLPMFEGEPTQPTSSP